jgi:hypothetical protein
MTQLRRFPNSVTFDDSEVRSYERILGSVAKMRLVLYTWGILVIERNLHHESFHPVQMASF